jgi:FkbM family methyltransferase
MRYTPRADCQIPGLADIYAQHLPETPGRFVEVGAFDGVTVSNTVFLAEAGWAGLYIEPHPDYAKLCAQNHARHLNIVVANTAISSFSGEVDLFVIGECSTLVWDKSAVDWGGRRENKITVRVTTLDLLLDGLRWKPGFELLVIDVEQSELKVLAGFDIRRWQPGLVIIEAHELDNAPERNCKAAPINAWFERYGYRKIHADHINSVFVRS